MSLGQSIWGYVVAIFQTWTGILGAIALVYSLIPKLLGEEHRVAVWLKPLDKSSKYSFYLCLLCYAYANFVVYSDVLTRADANLVSCQLTPAALAQAVKGLPTSIAGLKVGDVWNDGGVIAVAQP